MGGGKGGGNRVGVGKGVGIGKGGGNRVGIGNRLGGSHHGGLDRVNSVGVFSTKFVLFLSVRWRILKSLSVLSSPGLKVRKKGIKLVNRVLVGYLLTSTIGFLEGRIISSFVILGLCINF